MVPSISNSFDVLNFMVDVQEGEGRKDLVFSSPSTTSLVETINDLENQMFEKKLVLVSDDGKPLERSKIPMQTEATVTSVCEPSTTMEKKGEDSYSDEVEVY